jgi:clan AA aspartic protease (TIGR02281 family)
MKNTLVAWTLTLFGLAACAPMPPTTTNKDWGARVSSALRPAEKTNEEKISDLNRQLAMDAQALCSRPEYAAILARTPCNASAITDSHISDKTKLSDADRPAFVKLSSARQALVRRLIEGVSIWGRSISVPWSAALEHDFTRATFNSEALNSGLITWGEFNKTRFADFATLQAELAKLQAVHQAAAAPLVERAPLSTRPAADQAAAPEVVRTTPAPPVAPRSLPEPSGRARASEKPADSGLAVTSGTPLVRAPQTMIDSVRTALNSAILNNAPPVPEFKDADARLAYLRWLGQTSERLKNQVPDWPTRKEFLQTVWYEARRAGLDVSLVLGLIQVESSFRMFAVSGTGARGYMQVMPFWTRVIGDGDPSKLFHMQTNLRFGCVILRHYLEAQRGDLYKALGQYVSENLGLGRTDPKVLAIVGQIFAAQRSFVFDDDSLSTAGLERRPSTVGEKVNPSTPPPSKPVVVTIPVDQDGHYYLKGAINGIPVVFLVDTGATNVSISEELALRANVRGGKAALIETASGVENARVVDGVNVTAGPFSVPGGVPVVVARGLGNTVLLGQRFMQRFTFTVGDGRMVIRGMSQ